MTRKEAHKILVELLEERGIADFKLVWTDGMEDWRIYVYLPNQPVLILNKELMETGIISEILNTKSNGSSASDGIQQQTS